MIHVCFCNFPWNFETAIRYPTNIFLRSLKEEKYDLICKLPQNNPLVIFLWKKECIVKKERKSASFILWKVRDEAEPKAETSFFRYLEIRTERKKSIKLKQSDDFWIMVVTTLPTYGLSLILSILSFQRVWIQF